LKVTGFPGIDPCDQFSIMRNDARAVATAPSHVVCADPKRRVLTNREYIQEHFVTSGSPVGHGFASPDGASYWVNDSVPGFRLIGLNTMNPGGLDGGSIGQAQFDWFEAQLQAVHSRYFDDAGNEVAGTGTDRFVIIFSHHGLRSLSNQNVTADPMDPTTADLPRKLAADIQPLVKRFPNVIAWVNGHTHDNVVEPRAGFGGFGYWDIGTAAHIDFPSQSRLIEVVDNKDGTISVVCTMIDHAGPAAPTATLDPVLRLASISRELAANDYHVNKGPGQLDDRNVELVLKNPLPSGPSLTASSMLWLPRTPGQVAAAAALTGLGAVIKRRMARA
ncbi:MAG: hypothetical protein LC663_01390, partial [Actinobacteria bacterium]|nr:hypothetical protein [Actinomycetota bacterium]